jgi:hypothetical protein
MLSELLSSRDWTSNPLSRLHTAAPPVPRLLSSLQTPC